MLSKIKIIIWGIIINIMLIGCSLLSELILNGVVSIEALEVVIFICIILDILLLLRIYPAMNKLNNEDNREDME